MANSRKYLSRSGPWLAALAGMLLVLSACGGQDPAEEPAAEDAVNVGIFVDNAFGDGDFFDQAAAAEEQLVAEFGANVTTYEGQLQAQNFGPLLQDAADKNDIVFVLGFEAIDAMFATATANTDTQFVFVDADLASPDVVSAVFRTQEGCFMAGALAATVNAEKGSKTAGFIGGVNAPVIENCESGYTQGVAYVDDSQSVAPQYVGSFVDPAKGSEIATSLAKTKSAYGMFAYAGLSGAGAFDAAKSGVDIAPIGVVADKSGLAPGKVPGSLTMGVDKVILDVTKRFIDKTLTQGESLFYGFAEGGWDMVYDSNLLTADQIAALEKLEADISSGAIKVKE